METVFLRHDGRCKWLENKVLRGIYRDAMRNARDPRARPQYLILDWISNDGGKVGVDLKWLRTLGVAAVRSVADLPSGTDFAVVNTGYDSIVHEEQSLRARGVPILDAPCPFIRRVRKLLEAADPAYQYIVLCEANHIIVKNFASLFPADAILVQMPNYQARILAEQNGKPFMVLPYVTFLPRHVDEIMDFLAQAFPERARQRLATECMWIKSKASPIVEIESLSAQALEGVSAALLVTGTAAANKSVVSLLETLSGRGLAVTVVASLRDYRAYERAHPRARVLVVRSPIPNNTEREIMAYIRFGFPGAVLARVGGSRWLKTWSIGSANRAVYAVRWLGLRLNLIGG